MAIHTDHMPKCTTHHLYHHAFVPFPLPTLCCYIIHTPVSCHHMSCTPLPPSYYTFHHLPFHTFHFPDPHTIHLPIPSTIPQPLAPFTIPCAFPTCSTVPLFTHIHLPHLCTFATVPHATTFTTHLVIHLLVRILINIRFLGSHAVAPRLVHLNRARWSLPTYRRFAFSAWIHTAFLDASLLLSPGSRFARGTTHLVRLHT